MENSSKLSLNGGRVNPLVKLSLLIIMLVGIMIYPSWRFSFILLTIVLLLFPASGVSLNLSCRRMKFIIVFSILIFLLQVIITVNGTILWYAIPSLNGFGPYFPITDFGIERGLSISIRFLLVVLSSMLFVAVTDPTLLAHALTKLRIPYQYTFTLVIALRFLPLFDSENQIVRLAQKSRGIQPEIGGLRKILRTIQYTFFPLLVSSLSRVDTLAMSMDGRGFGYSKNRSYLRKSEWKLSDSVLIFSGFGYIILCMLLAIGYLQFLTVII